MDSLPAIRNLKADGAAVYFDKEYIKKTDGWTVCFCMEQVKGISRSQGRLRRRVAGYAPWQWFSGCLLMVGYTQIRPLSDYMACVSCSIPASLYTKKQTDEPSAFLHGAGEGNRTLDASLGSSNFTIKLHLQMDIWLMYVIILRMAELVKWMNHNINTIHIIKNRMQLLIIY